MELISSDELCRAIDESVVLKRCSFEPVTVDRVPQVVPTMPQNVSPVWDEVTKGMTEEQKEQVREYIKNQLAKRRYSTSGIG